MPAQGGNVVGVGVDLVEVERIRGMVERHGMPFVQRIFSEAEQRYCEGMKNPYPFFAARFAAKEAVSKAFRTGIGEQLGWRSVSIEKGPKGEPLVVLDEKGRNLLAEFGGSEILISLTHTDSLGHAVAVIIRH